MAFRSPSFAFPSGNRCPSNRTPITDSELDQMRSLRLKIQELEAAYNEINEAIASQFVEVRGVVKE